MREKKKFPFRTIVLAFIILIAGGYFIVTGYLNYLKSPVDSKGKTIAFVVQKGESASAIAERLEKDNLIRSAYMFKYLYKATPDAQIQAGDFKLSPQMSTEEIIKALQSGSLDKWVTLIEGWRDEQVAQELHDELGTNVQDFLKEAKQGYMFPDTYLFNPKSSVSTIVQTMENNFNQKYSEEIREKIEAKGLTDAEGVILASIVEREGRTDGFRTQVASILLKRLKIGMALNTDTSIQYAKDSLTYTKFGKVDKFWQEVTQEEYHSIVSPYNTYLHQGLPPGPLCNPSLSALNAVANANVNTPYLYYYNDSNGIPYYSKTLDEHTQNVSNHP